MKKKEKQYKCRQETCFVRITKKSRENLRNLAKKHDLTLQGMVEKLSTDLLK